MAEPVAVRMPGCSLQGGLYIGIGCASETGRHAAGCCPQGGQALVFASKTVLNTGSAQCVLDSLVKEGFSVEIYTGIPPEPHMGDIQQACDAVRALKAEIVVGIGGGSVLDAAKVAALARGNQFSALQLFGEAGAAVTGLPTILLPTTAGTGSEVSPYAVASEGDTKRFVGRSNLIADIALVDPLLMRSMPPKVTACTGLDALSHALEGMQGAPNHFCLAAGEKSVALTLEALPQAVAGGTDLKARSDMAYASVLGMMAYTQGGGLYAHSISYLLTAHFGIPHGMGCGMALPYTLRYNRNKIEPLYQRLTQLCGEDPAQRLLRLLEECKIPTSLKDIDVAEKDMDLFAEEMLERYPRPRNPRSMNTAQAKALFAAMYRGSLQAVDQIAG